jgi:DNA-binding NtrC family response regulator
VNEEQIKRLEERIISRFRSEAIAAALGDDRLVTEGEAAEILGISPKELSRKRLAKEIPSGYIGRSPRYSIGILRRFSASVVEG